MMPRQVRLLRGGVVLLAGGVLVAACSERLLDPAGPAQAVQLGVSLVPSAAVAGTTPDAFARTDAAHVRLTGTSTVLDTVVASSGAGQRTFVLPVQLPNATGTYQLRVDLTSRGAALFTGSTQVKLQRGYHESVQLTLTPIVAGVVVPDSLPTFTALGDTVRALAAAVFASGDSVGGIVPTWSDDSSGVVRALSDGRIVALREGQARVSATYQGFSASSRVRVQARVTQVALTPDSTTVFVDSTTKLVAVPRDRNGNRLARVLAWQSSDKSVATVDSTGAVHGVAAGRAVISASAEGQAGQAVVIVQLVPVAAVSLTPDTTTLVPGDQAPLRVTLLDAAGGVLTGRLVTWSSSNTAVATVDSTGVVTGVSQGTATITATSEGKSGSSLITVVQPAIGVGATQVLFQAVVGQGDPAAQQLPVSNAGSGTVAGLSATVTYSAGQPTGWLTAALGATTAPTALTLQAGITGLTPGSYNATVTVSSTSRGTTAALVQVTLTVAPAAPPPPPPPPPGTVASIRITPHTATVPVGGQQALSATPLDATGAPVSSAVTWTSLTPAIVSVSQSGLVTGLAAGTGRVTAAAGGKVDTATITVAVSTPVATLRITPRTATIPVGGQQPLSATPLDAAGSPLPYTVGWSSLDPGIVSVTQAGVVTGVATGTGRIVAAAGGRADTATVTVTRPVARVRITPRTAVIIVDTQQQLTGATLDASGGALPYGVTWTSLDPGVVSVTPTGLVTALAPGSGRVVAAAQGLADTATITVTPPVAAVQVSPRTATIAVGGQQQLGASPLDGSGNPLPLPVTWTSLDPGVVSVTPAGLVTGIAAGTGHVTASVGGVADTATVTVSGVAPTSWSLVRAGALSLGACGLTTAGAGYCWGRIPFTAQPGGGLIPTPVPGSATFTDIVGGAVHGCGVTTAGAALCWGDNTRGELGDGGAEASSAAPVTVSGGLTFRTVSVGVAYTCGLTTAGAAYCWGTNDFGELGSGLTTGSSTPVRVAGGLTFTSLSTGNAHACALTTAGQAYCWGRGSAGELGNNSGTISFAPVPVSGGLSFASIAAGNHSTCGTTTSGAVYCWGNAPQVGTSSSVPVAASATVLQQMAADSVNACGLDSSGAVQCAGANDLGQLGDGTTTGRTTFAPVAGTNTFVSVTVGQTFACGLTSGQRILCWGSNAQNQLGTGSGSGSLVPVPVTDP